MSTLLDRKRGDHISLSYMNIKLAFVSSCRMYVYRELDYDQTESFHTPLYTSQLERWRQDNTPAWLKAMAVKADLHGIPQAVRLPYDLRPRPVRPPPAPTYTRSRSTSPVPRPAHEPACLPVRQAEPVFFGKQSTRLAAAAAMFATSN